MRVGSLLCPVGTTKPLIVHLEGGCYLGNGDRFLHSPSGTRGGLFLQEFGSLFEGLGRGMLNSLVSHTERSVFTERKPPLSGSQLWSQRAG